MSTGVRSSSRRIVGIVWLALLCDLLAFTIPLPLFPRLINDFIEKESKSLGGTTLSFALYYVRSIREYLFTYSAVSTLPDVASLARWDLTLMGGLLASAFSFCQFIVSPRIGAWSDYGRRPVLLASMIGNILSAVVWIFSSSFGLYSISRLIGGLSEGNVQLSIAIISDVVPAKERSRSLALVGAAFSLAFTLGPSLGAYFASRTFEDSTLNVGTYSIELNRYWLPAAVSGILLVIETVGLYIFLPETKGWILETKETEKEGVVVERTKVGRIQRLRELESIHFAYLFCFSGAEFTLTFLTFNLFGFSNMSNGKLLGFIGILSSLLQGSYIRRRKGDSANLLRSGLITCFFSLSLLAALPLITSVSPPSSSLPLLTLYTAAAGLAFVSASVVNSLTALASLECTGAEQSDSGAELGRFRSRGQLGRAIGPLVSTSLYFIYGPSAAYAFGAVGCGVIAYVTRGLTQEVRVVQKQE